MQPSVWFTLLLVTIHCLPHFNTLLPINPRLGVGQGWYSSSQFPAKAVIILLLERKVALYLSELCEFLLAQSCMTWHSTVCYVTYCTRFSLFSDTCKCPECLLASVCFCQGCWGTCWTTAVSRMCSPKLLGVAIFLLLAQTSEKREDFHPSEFPVIIVLLTGKVVSCSVTIQVATVFHSGSKSFHPACGFCRAIQCCSSFIVFTKLNHPEAGWQDAVQQTHLWLQARNCLLHQVEGRSGWSRYILVVCSLYSLVFCTEWEMTIFLLGKILRVRWVHLFMFPCYELSCLTFSARNQVNYLNYERIISRFYW